MRIKSVPDGLSKTFAYGEQSRFVGMSDTFWFTWLQAAYFSTSAGFNVTSAFAYAVPRINGSPSKTATAAPCFGSGRGSPYDCDDWLKNSGGYPLNSGGSEFGEYGFRSLHPGGINVTMGDGSVQWVSNSIDRLVFAAMSTPAGGETNQ